jgi:hypothetical protein
MIGSSLFQVGILDAPQRPAAAQGVAAPPISMRAFMVSGDVATSVSIVMPADRFAARLMLPIVIFKNTSWSAILPPHPQQWTGPFHTPLPGYGRQPPTAHRFLSHILL